MLLLSNTTDFIFIYLLEDKEHSSKITFKTAICLEERICVEKEAPSFNCILKTQEMPYQFFQHLFFESTSIKGCFVSVWNFLLSMWLKRLKNPTPPFLPEIPKTIKPKHKTPQNLPTKQTKHPTKAPDGEKPWILQKMLRAWMLLKLNQVSSDCLTRSGKSPGM